MASMKISPSGCEAVDRLNRYPNCLRNLAAGSPLSGVILRAPTGPLSDLSHPLLCYRLWLITGVSCVRTHLHPSAVRI